MLDDEPMSPARRIVVNLVLVALIAGSAYDIVTDQEHWPFSQYPMFSGAWRSPRFSWLRLFGVTADGREFPLDANRFIAPFDQSRLPKALRRILDGHDAGRPGPPGAGRMPRPLRGTAQPGPARGATARRAAAV